MEKIKVILDTDIGLDIDDALALAYLLRQPRCELMGVTTFCGCAETRARLASAICTAAGRPDIPIHPGVDDCILVPQRECYAQQSAVLNKWPHQNDFPKRDALDFLRQTIRENPGEIVLLEIGPPSHIARLFLMDEEIPSLLRGLYLMGGKFGSAGERTWTVRDPAKRETFRGFEPPYINEILVGGNLDPNGCIDPYATAITYQYNAPVQRAVGADITTRVTMDGDTFRGEMRSSENRVRRVVMEMGDVFLQEAEIVTFHDPLVAATIFQENICQFERGNVSVELGSDKLLGYTYFEQDDAGRHEVACDVDVSAFFRTLFSVI